MNMPADKERAVRENGLVYRGRDAFVENAVQVEVNRVVFAVDDVDEMIPGVHGKRRVSPSGKAIGGAEIIPYFVKHFCAGEFKNEIVGTPDRTDKTGLVALRC